MQHYLMIIVVKEQDIRSDAMKKKINKIKKLLKDFDTYDRVYYEGKLFSLMIVLLCIICTILIGVIIWMI